MDVKRFLSELLSSLSQLDFVEGVALETEGSIVSGRVFLKGEMFLEVYFNEVTGTRAFAVNAIAVRNLAGICRDLDCVLVHISRPTFVVRPSSLVGGPKSLIIN